MIRASITSHGVQDVTDSSSSEGTEGCRSSSVQAAAQRYYTHRCHYELEEAGDMDVAYEAFWRIILIIIMVFIAGLIMVIIESRWSR